MADVVGITLIKRFQYRADTQEEFSNTYFLDGTVPTTQAGWDALAAQLSAEERKLFPPAVLTVKAYCYKSDNPDDDSVAQVDWTASPLPGTLSIAGGIPAPGDAAIWVRWKTSRTNSKGKAIFLRKYFHGVYLPSTGGDAPLGAQLAAATTFATQMKDGTGPTLSRKIRSQTQAETIIQASASPFVTTRTLKRRGKRPGS